QAARLDARHALDVAGHFHGAVDLALVIDIAAQVDDAVDGLNAHFGPGYVRVRQQARLHLGGDPGVIDRLVGVAVEQASVHVTVNVAVAVGHGAVAIIVTVGLAEVAAGL